MGRYKETAEPRAELQRQGLDVCDRIKAAAELAEAAAHLQALSARNTSKVIMETFPETLPFGICVIIPEGVEAFVSQDDEVVEENPESFIATEVTSIGGQGGVVFYDRPSDRRLVVNGFDIDVYPVFNDQAGEER